MSNTLKYTAVIHKDEDTAYWISAPDVPGCFSCGDSVEEAISNFNEALALHLEEVISGREPPPPARSEEDILSLMEEPIVQTAQVEIVLPPRASA